MNIDSDLRKKAENDFEKKGSFKLINIAVFKKTIENLRKHGDFRLVTTERRRNYLVSEPNYHTTEFFTENVLAKEMKKSEILMNKPVHSGLSVLEKSKMLIHEFWYHLYKTRIWGESKIYEFIEFNCIHKNRRYL